MKPKDENAPKCRHCGMGEWEDDAAAEFGCTNFEAERRGEQRRKRDVGYVARITGEACNLRHYYPDGAFAGGIPADRRAKKGEGE